MKTRIFVDMDGTIAEWRKLHPSIDPLVEIRKKGYFFTLKPYPNMVEATKELCKMYDVYILSAVISKQAIEEKNAWLDLFLPEVQNRIFTIDGQDKKNFVPGGVTSNDYLIDDRTLNLNLWEESGVGIKVLNGINSTKKTWKGSKVSIFDSAQDIVNGITNVLGY